MGSEMCIRDSHCSLFMFIVHCSHGATLIFDDVFIVESTSETFFQAYHGNFETFLVVSHDRSRPLPQTTVVLMLVNFNIFSVEAA